MDMGDFRMDKSEEAWTICGGSLDTALHCDYFKAKHPSRNCLKGGTIL